MQVRATAASLWSDMASPRTTYTNCLDDDFLTLSPYTQPSSAQTVSISSANFLNISENVNRYDDAQKGETTIYDVVIKLRAMKTKSRQAATVQPYALF
jgi:hypothetical protein